MSDKIEHPTAKDMRDQPALQDKTVEMIAGDRRWLEQELENALAQIEFLRTDNDRLWAELAKYACGCRAAVDCPHNLSEPMCRRVARAALAEQEKK